jgi:hypothetical protein
MSTTVLEALENAQINFKTVGKMGAQGHPIFQIAMEQLKNAITALDNGKAPDDILQESLLDEVKTD